MDDINIPGSMDSKMFLAGSAAPLLKDDMENVMDKLLDGKIALITGASRGIGKGIALRYAAEGAFVILTARSEDTLQSVLKEIEDAGEIYEGYTRFGNIQVFLESVRVRLDKIGQTS